MNPLSSLKRLFGRGADADGAGASSDATEDASRPRDLAAAFVDAHPDADLDYTPESLHALDDVADEVAAALAAATDPAATAEPHAEPAGGTDTAGATDDASASRAEGEDVEALNESVRRMGAYLGETFVRAYDGEWTFDDSAGWVVELPATHRGQPLVLTVPSVLGDVVEGESSFAVVHDVFASELDVDTPELAAEDPFDDDADPREEPAPADAVAAFDRLAAEFAAEHDALDFTPGSLGALDDVARSDREPDDVPFDPDVDDIDLSVRGRTDAIAGYFAAVVRTHHTAEYRGELAETLVVEGATRQATLEPRAIAAAAAADETSFETLYANLSEDLGLGTADA